MRYSALRCRSDIDFVKVAPFTSFQYTLKMKMELDQLALEWQIRLKLAM